MGRRKRWHSLTSDSVTVLIHTTHIYTPYSKLFISSLPSLIQYKDKLIPSALKKQTIKCVSIQKVSTKNYSTSMNMYLKNTFSWFVYFINYVFEEWINLFTYYKIKAKHGLKVKTGILFDQNSFLQISMWRNNYGSSNVC